jgi:pyridoxamine 5'-phosphate oxidase-like protein
VQSWGDLTVAEPELAANGRKLLINIAPRWGIALLGTIRKDGSPRIAPVCVYDLEGRLYATLETHKEQDLRRDPRYFMHSYWGEGQDEFAIQGEAGHALDDEARRPLDALEPRLVHSLTIRELGLSAAHSVIYRNFPRADMYAEKISWREGQPTRRWTTFEGNPDADPMPDP